jgi:hypothetical protein
MQLLWQMLLRVYWQVDWWHSQPKLFTDLGQMHVTPMQSRGFIQ